MEGENLEEAWTRRVVIDGYTLTNLRYADDTILLVANIEEMGRWRVY